MMFAIEINTELFGLVLAAAGVITVVWAVVTDNRRKAIIEAQEKLYNVKKEELAVEKEARQRERSECHAQIHELNGRVTAMESSWMRNVAEGVAAGVIEYLERQRQQDDP